MGGILNTPIALFVYNRLEHTIKTVEALLNNEISRETDLFIFSDGPKNEKQKNDIFKIRSYLTSIVGFKSIKIEESKVNLGLASSIIYGVNKVLNYSNGVIVMEDDLVASDNFLLYMNSAIDFYKDKENVYCVTGYNFPIELDYNDGNDTYLFGRAMSWGWATWKSKWDKASWADITMRDIINAKDTKRRFNKSGGDLYNMLLSQLKGEIDSWAIRWCFHLFLNNAYCVYPKKSMIQNIGFDGTGVHCPKTKKYDTEIDGGRNQWSFATELNTLYEKKARNINAYPRWKKIAKWLWKVLRIKRLLLALYRRERGV